MTIGALLEIFKIDFSFLGMRSILLECNIILISKNHDLLHPQNIKEISA